MKIKLPQRRCQAMTLTEVVVVIFVIALLLFVFLPPTPAPARAKALRIKCLTNLKQVGLGYLIWSGDNNDKLPTEVSVADGGTMELVTTPDAWKTFLVLSNELDTPKVLRCAADAATDYATNFDATLKGRISYFIGLDATASNSFSILSGDSNLQKSGSKLKSGFHSIASTENLEWDSSRHLTKTNSGSDGGGRQGIGNLLLGDGSVPWLSLTGLTHQLRQTGLATNRIVIP